MADREGSSGRVTLSLPVGASRWPSTICSTDRTDAKASFAGSRICSPIWVRRSRRVDYNFFGPKIGFDVFRFENDKIVEHWDNLQEKPASPNPSGHTMTDGPSDPVDLDKTETNKAFVRSFVDDILVNGRMEKLAGYYDGDKYVQHNPQIADGLSGLAAALKAMAEKGIAMKYERIQRVLG